VPGLVTYLALQIQYCASRVSNFVQLSSVNRRKVIILWLGPRNTSARERYVLNDQEGLMKKMMFGCAAIALTFVGLALPVDAKGCIKGAFVGGTAGHFAGHHGVLGAAAGCIIGHHEANKAARQDRVVQQPSTAGPH
jgi:hypothetical protein